MINHPLGELLASVIWRVLLEDPAQEIAAACDGGTLRLAGVRREQTSSATKMEDWGTFPFLLWFCCLAGQQPTQAH